MAQLCPAAYRLLTCEPISPKINILRGSAAGLLPLLFVGSAKFCGVLGPLAPPLVGLVPSHCERDLFNGICLKVPARWLRA